MLPLFIILFSSSCLSWVFRVTCQGFSLQVSCATINYSIKLVWVSSSSFHIRKPQSINILSTCNGSHHQEQCSLMFMLVYQVSIIRIISDEKVNVKHFINEMSHRPDCLKFWVKVWCPIHLYDCLKSNVMIPNQTAPKDNLHCFLNKIKISN